MAKVSPSILSWDFSDMQNEIKKIEEAGADYLHIDVMDGIFVPNITLGPVIIKAIRPHSKLFFDVHLMITEPQRYISEFAKAGADLITIHYEATENVNEAIDEIIKAGKKVGLSIKPKTDPQVLLPYLDKVDLILCMTVEPGFGGQSFIPETLENIKAVAKMVKECGRNIEIEVDGGISPKNADIVKEAGANVLVAGSAVFGATDMTSVINELKK